MKTKTLLIAAISFITILFMSCQKDEMGVGETIGGGMENNNAYSNSDSYHQGCDMEIEYNDSLTSKSTELLSSE